MTRRRWTKPRRSTNTCPTPGKTAYATRAAANQAAAASLLRCGYQLASYQCPCGWHHLTKGPGDAHRQPTSTKETTR